LKRKGKNGMENEDIVEAELVEDGSPIEVKIIDPQPIQRSLGYFALDGNYGDASGMLVLETTFWREVDWEILESASDSQRANVARLITESYEKPEDVSVLYDKFEQYGINLDDFMPREDFDSKG
jgi:hypothetical protein